MFRLYAVLACFFINLATVSVQAAELDYFDIYNELDKIEKGLNSGKITTKDTSAYLKDLNSTQDNVMQSKNEDAASLENVRKKLTALGPEPENGQKEPRDIAQKRKEFSSQEDKVKSRIAKADLALARIDDINNLILKIRNDTLLNNILHKQSSLLHPGEFWDSLVSFTIFLYDIAKSPADWYKELSVQNKKTVKDNLLTVCGAMIAALLAAGALSLYIKKWFGYKQHIDNPDYSQKLRAGIWMLFARGVIPAAIISAFLIWLKNTPLINNGAFGVLLNTAALYLLYFFLTFAVVKSIFTPNNSKWRLFNINDDKARSVCHALLFSITFIYLITFFQDFAARIDYNTAIVYSLKILANGIKAFCVILVCKKFLYDENESAADIDNNRDDEDDIAELSTSSKISLFITFLMTAAFALSLFGYIKLSEFIINRFIISVLILGGFYMVEKLVRVLFHQVLLLRFWVRIFRINRRNLVKTEFWFGLFLTPLLGITAFLTILAVWGVSVDILLRNVKNFLMGFNVGGIRISIISLLLGIAVFFISLSLFRLLKNSLTNGKLSKIDMDESIRNSLVAGIGFLGFIISLIISIAVMGGSFGSIAIMAGALSFGVGLGLQNIVSNFVSGIIILFERPIKIGDWVIVNGQEGIVKQINMRATELETFGKSNIIIPNSDILSGSLVNMTYKNRMGRIDITVGVDYDSDIDLVQQTLVDIMQNNDNILKNPAPFVSFSNLSDNSLDFQVSGFTSNVYNKRVITNNIRENIVKRFREKNINIPFPQRIVHVQMDQLPEKFQEKA